MGDLGNRSRAIPISSRLGPGRARGRFHYPTGVALFPDGRLLVADAYNQRLQVFDRDGSPVEALGFRWKRFLGLASAFHVPTDAAVDGRGRILVADSARKRVAILDGHGRFLGYWKLANDRHPAAYSSERITVGRDGRVYREATNSS